MIQLNWYVVYSGTNEVVAQVQALSKDEAENKVRDSGRSYMGALWAVCLPFYDLGDKICNQIVGELMWGPLSVFSILEFLNRDRPQQHHFDLSYIWLRVQALKREGVIFLNEGKWELVK